jgi:purine-cytosine permease-like protein
MDGGPKAAGLGELLEYCGLEWEDACKGSIGGGQNRTGMKQREQAGRIEIATIRPIPLDQRHGTSRDLFTVWFGANLMLLTIATGGLAVTVFAQSFGWAVIGIVIGNLVGGVFMALHAAQGPTLGVPQMIQTRGQFGSLGSLLVIGIVIVMYVGFVSSNLVLCGQAISLVSGLSDLPGILIVGVLAVIAAIYGYDLIHAYTRLMSYVCGATLLLAAAWIVWVHGLPADFLSRNGFTRPGFLGVISMGALWQIAYAPYVSDYSRYMPRDTGVRAAFWASFWGCTLGSILPMLLGAAVGLAAPKGSPMAGLALLTHGIAPLVLIVFTVSIAAASAMNLYCGALSTLAFGQTILPRWSPGPRSRIAISLVLFMVSSLAALLSKESFLVNYEDFILLLLYVLVPWTAINLVDYYLLRHGRYDVASFFRHDGGVYGRINGAAVTCYAVGILVQLPFIASPLYKGPLARALGDVDLSWIVGLAVTSPAYYWLAKRSQGRAAPAATL